MRLRWKGAQLRAGSHLAAQVYGSDRKGWWWSAGNPHLGIRHQGSTAMLVGSEEQAKRDAEAYVRACLKD